MREDGSKGKRIEREIRARNMEEGTERTWEGREDSKIG